jgi:hypothetical protein
MIATSRRSRSIRVISRQYEFSRLQGQTLALAYEVLVSVISRKAGRLPSRRADRDVLAGLLQSQQHSAAGA